MLLARVLSKIYKEDGIILIDSKGQKYICGNPRSEKPITLKLLKEVEFINSYSFIFSPRPGTPASKMKKIDENLAKERLKILEIKTQ